MIRSIVAAFVTGVIFVALVVCTAKCSKKDAEEAPVEMARFQHGCIEYIVDMRFDKCFARFIDTRAIPCNDKLKAEALRLLKKDGKWPKQKLEK